LTVAAGCALAVVCGGIVLGTRFAPSGAAPPPLALRSPQVISPEHRTLPDGTRVDLAPGTVLAVRFVAGASGPREVVLSRGDAHFEVAPDPARPFVVKVGSARFRAVGTAFSVGFGPADVELHVTEGRVAVDAPGQSEPLAVVSAGHRALVDPAVARAPEVAAIAPAATAERFAWRVPRLEFDATPLAEVVAQLNRHGTARLRLIGRDLQRIEISGSLRADNLDPLLRSLETTYGLRVSRLPDGTIALESAR
jgi:transmembrane sensor